MPAVIPDFGPQEFKKMLNVQETNTHTHTQILSQARQGQLYKKKSIGWYFCENAVSGHFMCYFWSTPTPFTAQSC